MSRGCDRLLRTSHRRDIYVTILKIVYLILLSHMSYAIPPRFDIGSGKAIYPAIGVNAPRIVVM